jgi:hypothetical protein
MGTRKIDEIRQAARDYGKASRANYEYCLRLKNDVISTLNDYLAEGEKVVLGVPPSGEWNPEQGDYRDQALDIFDDPLVMLRDIEFGVAVRLDNLEDSGCCWVRVPISVRRISGNVEMTVGDQPVVRVSLDYGGHLTKICEAVRRELLAIFQDPVAKRRSDLRGIGSRP